MKVILLGIITLIYLIGTDEPVRAGNDWNYWSSFGIVGNINDRLDFKMEPESRYKNDFSEHYYMHFEMGLDYRVTDWFLVSPYYRHVNERENGDWKVEYRPHLNVTFKWKPFDVIGADLRNRLEYRIRENKSHFRDRLKLKVKGPQLTRIKLQPYIAEEIFYDFDGGDLNKNRLYAGIDSKLAESFKVGIFYMLLSSREESGWTGINVLGTALAYSF